MTSEQDVAIEKLNDALDRLAAVDARLACVVTTFHIFLGFSLAEVADALDISAPTAERDWRFARAWLRQSIKPDGVPHAGHDERDRRIRELFDRSIDLPPSDAPEFLDEQCGSDAESSERPWADCLRPMERDEASPLSSLRRLPQGRGPSRNRAVVT